MWMTPREDWREEFAGETTTRDHRQGSGQDRHPREDVNLDQISDGN